MSYTNTALHDQQALALREEEEARQLAAQYRMQAAYEKHTTPTINLLIKTLLLPWESLESLLFRAAAMNHLTGIYTLKRSLMLPENGLMSIKRHLQLSIAIGQDLNALSPAVPTLTGRSTVKLYGHTLPSKHLALTTCRVCLDCLNEFSYGKAYWMLAPFSACESHKCLLIDSCPTCDAPLTGGRPSYNCCPCGADLSKLGSTRCSEALYEMSRILVHKFTGQNTPLSSVCYSDEFLSLELLDMLELLTFLGALTNDPGTTFLSLSRRVVNLKHTKRSYIKSTNALLNWPVGFHKLLASSRSFRSYGETPANVYNSISHVTGIIPANAQPKWCRLVLSGIESFLKNRDAWSISSN